MIVQKSLLKKYLELKKSQTRCYFSNHQRVKFTRVIFNQPLVFRIALKAERIFFAARFFLEAVGAKWGRQQRERPLESKLRRLGGKNKPVKENAAASNEPINSRGE